MEPGTITLSGERCDVQLPQEYGGIDAMGQKIARSYCTTKNPPSWFLWRERESNEAVMEPAKGAWHPLRWGKSVFLEVRETLEMPDPRILLQ